MSSGIQGGGDSISVGLAGDSDSHPDVSASSAFSTVRDRSTWKSIQIIITNHSNGSNKKKAAETKIKFRGHYFKQVEEFVYLGSDINKEGRIKKEISITTQSSVKCYHLIKSILWNQDIPLNCKKNMY